MINRDHSRARNHIARLLACGPSIVVVQACALWIDELLNVVTRPATLLVVPELSPADMPSLQASDLWALRLIAARANQDTEAARQLFLEAPHDPGVFLERTVAVLTLVAWKLASSR
ncbi:hypothetical protein [Nocardia jejuensis]|uniref:hypothetical protein n=1 Tax=Nocardia jejuensis TaxID=328049 RepID=UPI00082FD3D3|nr:hypothetical protein [Nocardia jejuensis]